MAEKKTIELEVKTDSVKSLKTQLKEAQQEVQVLSDKFGATSKEAINAAKKAAELKDAIEDAKALTDAFNPDAKFNALTQSLSGVAGGFSAVQGAMGLFGSESENVQKALLKVQSAMALSQGIQQLGEARDSFKQLKAVIGQTAIGQKLLTAAQVVGAATMRVLNTVMKANPIFLIIAGILAAVAAFKYFSSSTETATEKNDKLNASLERQEKQLQRNNDALKKNGENRLKILQAQGASEEEIHNQTLDNLENEEVARLKNLEFIKQKIKEKRAILKQAYEDEDEELIKSTAKEINDARGKYFELIRLKRDNTTNIIVEEESYAKKLRDKKAEADKKDAEEANKKAEEANKKAEERRKKKAEDDRIEAERRAMMAQGEIDADKAAYEYFAEQDRKEAERKEAARLKEMEDEQMLANFREEIRLQGIRNEEEAQAKKKLLRQQEIQFASDGFKLIGEFTELMGKRTDKERRRAFKIKKAADLASATIDGTKAVLSTYADTPGGPIIKGVAAGIAGAFSAIQIAKISKQQFDGGAPSDGGGGNKIPTPNTTNTSSGVIAPKFNVVGASANQLNTLQQQPIQAYVVSGDVTSAQSLDRNRIKNATL